MAQRHLDLPSLIIVFLKTCCILLSLTAILNRQMSKWTMVENKEDRFSYVEAHEPHEYYSFFPDVDHLYFNTFF